MRVKVGLLLAAALLLASTQDGRADVIEGKVLSPAEAAALAQGGGVRILDIRDTEAYAEGHLPGAVSAPYPRWRGPAENPGRLPERAALAELVQDLGIDAATPVIIAHAGKDATDFGAAARVYWTLKTLGVSDLAILNGGVTAWQAAGLPLDVIPPTIVPSSFEPAWDTTWLATADEVQQQMAAGDGRLLDARPSGFFLGELWHDAAAKPGTIKGAESFTYERWFEAGGPVIVGPDAARAIVTDAGLDKAPITVSFCNTGHWAATNWFALSELAEVPGVKLYPESMVGWSAAGLPMDNVPGRIEWLWLSTKKWLDETFG